MSLRFLLSALSLSLLAAIVPAAGASTYTYLYVGAPYDAPFSTPQPHERVTGFITVDAPLTPGEHSIDNPVNYYFSDGTNNYNPAIDAVAPYLALDINSAGAVDNWSLSVIGQSLYNQPPPSIFSDPRGDIVDTGAGRPFASTDAGRWTSSAVNPTPEPSTLVLLGTGVLSMAGLARRRFAVK